MAIYIIGLLENGKEKMVRLYNDKKNQYRDMSEKDVLFMLDEETIKIKNAEIKENKLVGSTGSLKKITNQNVFTVVGYIGDVDEKPLAYKFVDSNGKVYIVKIVDCIDFFNRNLVQNASIVENKYIRGINWTIPCVEQKKEVKEAEQKKEVEQKEEEKIIPFEITAKNASYFIEKYLKNDILDIPSNFERDGKKYCVTSIGTNAFCSLKPNVIGVKFPDSVEKIDKKIFEFEDNSIEYIYLGKNVKNIITNAFVGTPYLEKIEVSPNNPYYCSKDNVLFTKGMKNLVKYPRLKSDISYKVPDEVEVILEGAFDSVDRLLKIDLGKGLREIEKCAFLNAGSLLDIIIHKNLKKIGSDSLNVQQVSWSNERDPEKIEKLHIYYEGPKEDWSEVYRAKGWTETLEIEKGKYKYWYDIVYDYKGSLDSIGPIPFDGDYSYLIDNFLKDGILDIPSIFEKDGKTYYLDEIDDNCANELNSINIKQINLGYTLKSISIYSFNDTGVESINIHPNNSYYCSKDGVLFTKDMKTLVKYPEGKPNVSYKVPDSVEKIEDLAFERAWKLRKIDLGVGLKEIGIQAFNLACDTYDFIIHKNLQTIHGNALNIFQVIWSDEEDPEKIEKIHIHYKGSKEDWSKVNKVEDWTDSFEFENGKWEYWYDIVYDYKGSLDNLHPIFPLRITVDNSNYFIEHFLKDGILNIPSNFERDGEKYTVVAINAGAFYGIDTNVIKCIKIPDSVTELGNAFNCYRGVKYIYFGKNVKNLETLFKWNSDEEPLWWKLEKIKVSPENPYYCSENGILFTKDMKTLIKYPTSKKGQSYKVPEMVEKIAPYAFYKHSCLRSIDLGKSLIEIGPSAFEMGSVCRFKVPKTLKFIDVDAFQNQFAFDTPEELTKNKIVFYYEGSQEDWIKIEKADSWIDNYTQNWIIKETAYTELYHKVHYNYKKE